MAQLRNPHPGEILKEEFLSAIGMSQNQLAHTIGVPGNRIHAIVIDPSKADAPSVIYPNAHLTDPASLKDLQSIARWIS